MEILDKIREQDDLLILANKYVRLKRKGKKHLGNCPFCKSVDTFTIDYDKQLFHCFGCGQGGDIITFIMEKENMGFPEAIKELSRMFDIEKDEPVKSTATQDQLDIIKETIIQLRNVIRNCEESLGLLNPVEDNDPSFERE